MSAPVGEVAVLVGEGPERVLTGEDDLDGGAVGDERVGRGAYGGHGHGDHGGECGPPLRERCEAPSQAMDQEDADGDEHGHRDRPQDVCQVGPGGGVEPGQAQGSDVQPGPVAEPGEDERAHAGRQQARQDDSRSAQLRAAGGLEDEHGRDQRPAEDHGHGRRRSGGAEECALGRALARPPSLREHDGRGPAEGDERCFGAEDDAERQAAERGEQHAGHVRGADGVGGEAVRSGRVRLDPGAARSRRRRARRRSGATAWATTTAPGRGPTGAAGPPTPGG